MSFRHTAADAACYTAGSLLYAASVNMFAAPNGIAPGGATGAATLLHELCGVPIGGTVMLINLPLLLAAYLRLGRGFTVRTLLAAALSSVVIDVTAPWLPAFLSQERLLACLCGGVLSGAGLGLICLRGATTGGSEIAARLLAQRFPAFSIGRMLLAVDAVVIVAAGLVYGSLTNMLYATVMLYVSTRVLDAVVYGVRTARVVYIVTDRAEEMTAAVLQTLHRGVTALPAVGGYSGRAHTVLFCVVRRTEAAALRALVRRTDPAAFLMTLPAEQVEGEGFR